jgi:very-short-patch-repair endonuclease
MVVNGNNEILGLIKKTNINDSTKNGVQNEIIQKIESWRDRLLDPGSRNPLINSSFDTGRGVLELLNPKSEMIWRKLITSGEAGSRSLRFAMKRNLVPPPDDDPEIIQTKEKESKDWNPSIDECLASQKLREDDLLTSIGDRALDRKIRTLDGYAKLSVSEQGIHSLFIAFGFIKWYESAESNKEIRSPIILVPATFSRETSDSPWELQEAEDDVIDNLCLRQRFKQDFGLILPELPELEQLVEEGARLAYFAELKRAIANNERWDIEDRCCLGRFAFPKIAMWQDLGDHIEAIANNLICQSIAGKSPDDPKVAFGDPATVPDPKWLDDDIQPGEIKAILDCDSSQLEAIIAARKGLSFVLDGPPGTGKSQTIANIIADALSVGKRVLFVSEKVAALDVVKRRLDDSGLGDFCLECHSSKANRKALLEELKCCLEIPKESYPDPDPKLKVLLKKRQALNDYVRNLHAPQQQTGLSMYQLHGNIARLIQQGMLGKSSVNFSNPESISQVDLDNWIQTLRLAGHHKNVIDTFSSHPWRGCKLTTSPLALKTDIRSKLTILEDCSERLAKLMRPFVENGLLPISTSLTNLPSVIETIEGSLKIPNIPKSWFSAPREIANALLKRNQSYLVITKTSQALTEYVDNITSLFKPEDVVPLSKIDDCKWLPRPNLQLPGDYEAFVETLATHSQELRRFERFLSSLEGNLKRLVDALKLPIKLDLPIGSVGKLIGAARLISTDAPFQPSWFDEEKANALAVSAQQALSQFDSIKQLESKIEGRIELSALFRLASDLPSTGSFQQHWEVVSDFVPSSQIQSLTDCGDQLNIDIERLSRIVAETKALCDRLQLKEDFAPTLSEIRNLIQALPEPGHFDSYHGCWGESVKRQKVKSQIEAAMLDLKEAQDLRSSLEQKFSHRAFAPSGRPLIERGKAFTSLWWRFLGGFSKYRVEISDFYKGPVPGTSLLLEDVLKLGTYHKRMREVEDAYGELKDYLLNGLIPDQMESWKKNLTAINTFESFITKFPQVIDALPPCAVAVDNHLKEPWTLNLIETIDSLVSGDTYSLLPRFRLNDSPIHNILSFAKNIQSSIQFCSEFFKYVKTDYQILPCIEQLLSDLFTAKRYINHREILLSLFNAHVKDFPIDASPFHFDCWVAASRGVESARKLVKIFGAAPVLRETVCLPGRVNRESLTEIVNATEVDLLNVNKVLSEFPGLINLTRAGDQEVDPRKRVTTELKSCVVEAVTEIETTKEKLSKLVSLLRPGRFVPFTRLPQDSLAIEEMRISEVALRDCESVLIAKGIVHSQELTKQEASVATWISQAPDTILQSPLAKAISTDSSTRYWLEHLVNEARAIMLTIIAPLEFFRTLFDDSEKISPGFIFKDLSLEALPRFFKDLVSSVDSIDEWIQFNRWRQQLSEAGLSVVLDELIRRVYLPHEAVDAVCAKLYQKLFDCYIAGLPSIANFNSLDHEQIRQDFCQLDEWEIKAASTRVRKFQLERDDRPRIGWLAPITSELGILKKETEKQRRHMPLRKLFAAIPGVLQRLKPCIMMSPLSVSTFLQAEELKFDLVIFDEASQVFPWDAIGAVYRGTQLIVAGDEKQLPPTSFFSRSDIESEDKDEDIGDFESILSLCKSVNMPNKRLRWHYRSRREPLIAFSNRHFYDGDLVTFPSILDATLNAVTLIHVADGRWIDRKNLAEARKVAELVVAHYKATPDKSLGVIAFNMSQQQAIEDALYDLRRDSPETDALFSRENNEPLFIKNLENVQGDERDFIFLSFGYGKNETGKFLKNFGPLSKQGGERRLNVAVTRAREAICLVASVRSADMDLSGTQSKGASLLKSYLEYAELGVDLLGRTIVETQSGCESPFEEEVAAALIRHGLEPIAQVGCGGFRIDFALKHPSNPGVYCLGIECDGATYHSSKTARDRDRIRQNVLEGLGWRICRVWSTEWVRKPQLQIQKILTSYQQASSGLPDIALIGNKEPETEFEDLQPKYVADVNVTAPTFLKIDNVPVDRIIETAERILARVGTMDWSELIILTSKELGFVRTGIRIRERIELIITEQVHQSTFHRNGDRISLIKETKKS